MATVRASRPMGLLDLSGQLFTELARLLDQRLALLKAELKQDAADVARRVALVAAGGLGLAIGVAFLLLALGLGLGRLVGSAAGGMAIVGGALTLVGGVLGMVGAAGLRRQRLAEETARQLRRDAEWIRHEV